MSIDYKQLLQDCRQFKSPATTLFYLGIVLQAEPKKWSVINIRQIAKDIGITNPYKHMKRVVDAKLLKRENLTIHGTRVFLHSDYRGNND